MVGDSREGDDEYRVNVEGAGYDVQGSRTVGAVIK